MKNHYDRTGVFRRQLFQSVASDVRLAFIKKCAPAAGADELASAGWRNFLQKICKAAAAEHCMDSLVAAALEFGVGVQTKVIKYARELVEAAGLKRLEQERFLKAMPPAPRLPYEEEEDPFGHGGGLS